MNQTKPSSKKKPVNIFENSKKNKPQKTETVKRKF